MAISLIIFWGFIAFILYRLVFNFIIPIYRTTKRVKKGFREMQEKMREGANPHGPKTTTTESNSGVTGIGDYIDFEEVK